jgi:hypothetical protein
LFNKRFLETYHTVDAYYVDIPTSSKKESYVAAEPEKSHNASQFWYNIPLLKAEFKLTETINRKRSSEVSGIVKRTKKGPRKENPPLEFQRCSFSSCKGKLTGPTDSFLFFPLIMWPPF